MRSKGSPSLLGEGESSNILRAAWNGFVGLPPSESDVCCACAASLAMGTDFSNADRSFSVVSLLPTWRA